MTEQQGEHPDFIHPGNPTGAKDISKATPVPDSEVTAEEYASSSRKAFLKMMDILEGKLPNTTVGQQLTAAQWLLEKHSGRPKQQIEETSTLNLSAVIEALGRLRDQALTQLMTSSPSRPHTIDVTPARQPGQPGTSPEPRGPTLDAPRLPERDEIDAWVEDNVPLLENEVRR